MTVADHQLGDLSILDHEISAHVNIGPITYGIL